MFDAFKLKRFLNWPLIRAHICTAAIAFSFNSTWRVPRDGLRYGGISYGLVFSAMMVGVGLPSALLQLSVGQLSQQDAVGIWSAVPFFKGVGYLRLLISYLASIYTVAYVAITATNFFYSLNNNNPIPVWDCRDDLFIQDNNDSYVYNMSTCLNSTILAPAPDADQPEYYIATALLTLLLWVLCPIILYSPAKYMKKVFYGMFPVVLILAIVILSCIGSKDDVSHIYDNAGWSQFARPHIWHSSVIQAAWSTQVAGGYLIPVGDTVYSCTDVVWTAVILVVMNTLTGWFGLIFWFGVGGSGEKDTSVVAVLTQTYKAVAEKNLNAVWLPLVFAMLFISGVITVVTMLYPVYERFKRLGGHRWRYLAAGSGVVGAGAALAALAVGLPALQLLDDVTVPLLVSVATLLEICPFICIYGWRMLIEDIEFLVGRDVSKYWVWGWCGAGLVILASSLWWVVVSLLAPSWAEPPWVAGGLVAAAVAAAAIVIIFAIVTVSRQVQYDVIGKLKCSFRPSRHWGPRDPITHYYWLARREDPARDQPRTRYHRRQLGQFSGNSSFLNLNNKPINNIERQNDCKRRSNSDDWLYAYRRQCFAEAYQEQRDGNRKRSKSLDWAVISTISKSRSGYKKQMDAESEASATSGLEEYNYIKHL